MELRRGVVLFTHLAERTAVSTSRFALLKTAAIDSMGEKEKDKHKSFLKKAIE